MNIQKTSKTYIMLIGIVALNTILVAGYFFAFKTIQKVSNEVAIKEKDASSYSVQDTRATHRFTDGVDQIIVAEETFKTYFVDFDDRERYLSFLEYIESLPTVAGVKTTTVSSKIVNGLQFRFTYEGAFNNVLYFIALVESLPYNTTVDDVFLEELSPGSGVWRGSMSITLPGSGL